jgi:hypothetical protein
MGPLAVPVWVRTLRRPLRWRRQGPAGFSSNQPEIVDVMLDEVHLRTAANRRMTARLFAELDSRSAQRAQPVHRVDMPRRPGTPGHVRWTSASSASCSRWPATEAAPA